MTDQPFALRFPLQNSQLIEASAGTGKTFTIATLYLRLVLGHGTENSKFNRPLLPPEILVMTFTEAATQELKDRIRTRLFEAARYFREELHTPDELLITLRQEYPTTDWPLCAQKLDIAAQWMDEAAVSTIHSWCQRMLREHAFDSGNLFQQTLKTDHSELLAEIVRDYWRLFCYPLTDQALEWVIEHWQSPNHLRKQLTPLLEDNLPQCAIPPIQLLETQLTAHQQQLTALKEPWGVWAEELQQLCDDIIKNKLADGRKLQKRFYDSWCHQLKTWASDPLATTLDLKTGFERLTPEGLAEIWKTGEPPQHPALQAMATLKDALNNLPNPSIDMLLHAQHWVKTQLNERKIQRAEIGFNDLLTRLDSALHSPSGSRLSKLIREQFPVAMVDEFQDTDPIQYRILSKIYLTPDSQAGLFLIGDPKQAIYAFRGADIYTYLQARQYMGQRIHHLDTNYRSTKNMIEATNQLFNHAEQHNPLGAFLFKNTQNNPLPFIPVQSNNKQTAFVVENEIQPSLTLWHNPTEKPISFSDYFATFAESTASEIARLLNLGQQYKAGFQDNSSDLKPLHPADIAILVRSGREASIIREALAQHNIRSVYLSDKDSVLKTQEAEDILFWLQACAQPENEAFIRTALATITLNLSLAELDSYNQSENKWEARIAQFQTYKHLWQNQGILPMLRHFLQDFQLPNRLLANTQNGERILTNILHLSELLQQAATELDGEQALIRYLAEHIEQCNPHGDETIIRLESDEQLVKVITIHKSKGLEYPLVFLPFICSFRPTKGDLPIRYHDEHLQPKLSLYKTTALIEKAEQERLSEDLRLLYVAITRAKYGCYMGITDLTHGKTKSSLLHRSALGYLINQGNEFSSPAHLTECLHQLTNQCPALTLQKLPTPHQQLFASTSVATPTFSVRQMKQKVYQAWWVSSYSSLHLSTNYSNNTEELAPVLPEESDITPLQDEDTPYIDTDEDTTGYSIHHFPKGPLAGTFLHNLLEWAAKTGFRSISQTPHEVHDFIARRCNIRGWEHWIDLLQQWLQTLIKQPLPLFNNDHCSLIELPHYLPEMEFMFTCHQVNLEQLDRIVTTFVLPNRPRPLLEKRHLNGVFKGFIDLSFEFNNRYYIVDYKSNWLGNNNSAYSEQAMNDAMLNHRYDLQLALYQLALHRQLKARLIDYHYDIHIGGALYLFLRGYQSNTQGVFYKRIPFECIEALDHLFQNTTAKDTV